MEPLDTPAYLGNSLRRIIVIWHYGNDFRIAEATAYSTRTALAHLIPGMPQKNLSDATNALDGWRSFYDGWGWYRIHKVWAWDKRPARTVHNEWEAQEREAEASLRCHNEQRRLHPERYRHESCDHHDGYCAETATNAY